MSTNTPWLKRTDKYLSGFIGSYKRIEYDYKPTIRWFGFGRPCRIIRRIGYVWWDINGCLCVGPGANAFAEIQCNSKEYDIVAYQYYIRFLCNWIYCGDHVISFAHGRIVSPNTFCDGQGRLHIITTSSNNKYHLWLYDYREPSIQLFLRNQTNRYIYRRYFVTGAKDYEGLKIGLDKYQLGFSTECTYTPQESGILFNLRMQNLVGFANVSYTIVCLCSMAFQKT